MRNIIIVVLVGILLFGASFAASTFVFPKAEAEAEMEDGSGQSPASDPNDPQASTNEEVPVPFRPKTITEEAVLKMAESIRLREEDLKRDRAQLAQKMTREQFILGDIQREKRELEALQQVVKDKIVEAQKLIRQLQQSKQAITAERQQIEKRIVDLEKLAAPESQSIQKNLQQAADWLTNMQPEKSSQILKQFCDDGQMDRAVEILVRVDERAASKMLAPLDSQLVKQLIEKRREVISLKQAARSRSRRRF